MTAAGLQDGDPAWRESDDGHAATLGIIAAGLAAIGIGIGIEADEAAESQAPQSATGAMAGAHHAASNADSAPTTPTGAKERMPREGTKQEMLRARDGGDHRRDRHRAGMDTAYDSRRMSGALKKKRGRVYHLPRV